MTVIFSKIEFSLYMNSFYHIRPCGQWPAVLSKGKVRNDNLDNLFDNSLQLSVSESSSTKCLLLNLSLGRYQICFINVNVNSKRSMFTKSRRYIVVTQLATDQ